MASKKADTTTAMTAPPETTAAAVYDYGEHATEIGQVGHGYENQTSADQAIPFIKLMQPLSPEITKRLVPGAQAGMFCNALTGRLWKNPEGLIFIPCLTKNEWVAWKDKDKGGGISGRYSIESPEVGAAKKASTEFGEYFVQNGENQGDVLVESFYVFGIACDEEMLPLTPAIIPFKSTTIKPYKSWMSQLRSDTVPGPGGRKVNPPLYAHTCRLTTIEMSKGDNVWWIPHYEPAIDESIPKSRLSTDSELFQMAFALYTSVKTGSAKVDYSQDEPGGKSAGGAKDGESPF